MNLGIAATKLSDVRLITRIIEPAEHLVELFAEKEPHHRHGKPLKLHRLAENTTENLSGLGICQLASGNLQVHSDEFFGALESQSHKGANIVSSDGLIGFISADRVDQLAFQNPDFNFLDVVGFHEGNRPKDCRRQTEFANILLNLPLTLPMIDAGAPLRSAHGTVDKMLHTGLLCRLRQVLALLYFTLRADRPEVLDTINSISAMRCAL